MKRRIQVGGSVYAEDGGFTFTEAGAEATSVDPEFPIIEVPEADWQRWLSVQDFKELYNSFSKLALDESVRIGNEQHRRQAELERDIQKLKSGKYKIVPTTESRHVFDSILGVLDPDYGLTLGKIVPYTAVLGGPEVAAAIEPGRRIPFRDGGKDVGYCDNFRVENGKTVCDVHLDAYRPE